MVHARAILAACLSACACVHAVNCQLSTFNNVVLVSQMLFPFRGEPYRPAQADESRTVVVCRDVGEKYINLIVALMGEPGRVSGKRDD